jgi:hypothetical protein
MTRLIVRSSLEHELVDPETIDPAGRMRAIVPERSDRCGDRILGPGSNVLST